MLKVVLLATLVVLVQGTPINPSLSNKLTVDGQANVIVTFASGNKPALDVLQGQRFPDRSSRLNSVATALKSHAAKSQKDILAFLTKNEVTFYSLWISNKIAIPNADTALVEKLAFFSGIAEIHEEHMAYIDDPLDLAPVTENDSEIRPFAQPGIEVIQAHYVWSELQNNGSGSIIGNIDTGVRGTHEILRENHVGSHGWFDPPNGTWYAEDSNGHGTHTMGTMVGRNGYGVAPGAKWMACRGCATGSCPQIDLERCAQFILCPTRPDGSSEDCSKAPHVINNSWGGGQGQTWYNPFIEAWRYAGIIPVFSNGNSGPECGTANSPADSVVGVIGVGSTTNSDALSYFSSQGPTQNIGMIKPDITAPGSSVRSSYYTGDASYTSMSGTSMAAPHVSGTIALLFSELEFLSYADVEKFLYTYTDRTITQTEKNCGGVGETIFPNNAFGWGRTNAFKAVRALRNSLKY